MKTVNVGIIANVEITVSAEMVVKQVKKNAVLPKLKPKLNLAVNAVNQENVNVIKKKTVVVALDLKNLSVEIIVSVEKGVNVRQKKIVVNDGDIIYI